MLVTRLDNGMEVALDPDERADAPDVAAVYCWMDVGSAWESAGCEGAAHFIEHLVFKGTDHYGVGQVASAVEGLGGDLNAWTSFEETVFHATVPSAGVEGAVDVLAEMLRRPKFDADELERERKVVLEEIRGGEDDPGMVVNEATWAACFPGEAYGRSVIGTMDSVGGLPRADLLAFHARYYMPANGRVVISGRFDRDRVARAIAERFSGGAARPAPVRRRAAHGKGGTTLVRRRFDTRVVRVAFPAPGHTDPLAPTYDVLAGALGRGVGTPLIATMSAIPGVHSVSVEYEAEAAGGLLVAELQVSPGLVRSALDRLSGLLAESRAGEIEAADVARARVSFATQRAHRHQSVDGRAADVAFSLAHHGTPTAWRDYDARIAATDVETVRALAKTALDPALAQLVALAPGVRSLAPGWRARPSSRGGTAIVRERLPNGARILIERTESPLASAQVVGLGGLAADTAEFAGLSSLWANTVGRGAGGMGRSSLARTLMDMAASAGGSAGRSSQALRLGVPSLGLGAGLEFLLAYLTDPMFADDEVELAKQTMLDDLAARDDDPEAQLSVVMAEKAFGNHGWALDPGGTPETIARLGAPSLRAFHQSWARPENLVFAVVGDVDVDALTSRLRHVLGKLPAVAEPFQLPAVVHRRQRARVVLASALDQAHISMFFRGLNVQDRRAPALDVLMEVLSSQSGRLFTELREARGLAYSVGASSVEGPFGGVVSAELSTDPGRVVEAERALSESLAAVAAGGILEPEIVRAKAAILGGAEASLQSTSSRAFGMAYGELYGGDGRKYRAQARRAATVEIEDVRAIAALLLRRPTVTGRIGGHS